MGLAHSAEVFAINDLAAESASTGPSYAVTPTADDAGVVGQAAERAVEPVLHG